jgi:DNA-directed RNA polymerase subunit beta'
MDADGKLVRKVIDTTPGRMKIASLLPHHPQVGHRLIEKALTKKEIGNLIDTVYRHCGQKATVIFADQIMGLGFKEAAKAGISFGKDDIVIPERKKVLVAETRALVEEYEQQYADGLITKGEKYNKVVDAWAKSTDRVADAMMDELKAVHIGPDGRELEINSIYMMANSGARGSQAQMKQLGGMRGLMAKPSGEIIETPIISNFKEGLTVLEYFNSTHGARKGLADTALKTANSGYLTRRLVDVAQDSIITEEDCGTTRGITLKAVVEGGDVLVSLGLRVLGRFSAEDIKDPTSGEVLIPADTYLVEDLSDIIDKAGVQSVKVRSVLTCEANTGVCGACYGRDLARGTPVNIGEAVGVIAAQ